MHQCLGLILEPSQKIKEVLAPYLRNDENPNGFMDYYYIGNKWAGTIHLKPGGTAILPGKKISELIVSESQMVEVMLGGYIMNGVAGYADIAKVKDIDFGPKPSTVEAYGPVWETLVNGSPPSPKMQDEVPWLHRDEETAQRLIEIFGDKERFLAVQSCYPFESVLTPDGKFHPQDVERFTCQGLRLCYAESGLFHERMKEYLLPENILAVIDYHL